MTLVEVMAALLVFAVAILGTLSTLIFSLRTVDDSRSFTQITQILNHEMESMRMRAWADRTLVVDSSGHTRTLHGISTLGSMPVGAAVPGGTAVSPLPGDVAIPGAVSECYTTFSPFAVYGQKVADVDDPTLVAVISGSNSFDIQFQPLPGGAATPLRAQYRNALGSAAGFNCTRRVTLLNNGCGSNYALVTLTASWLDQRGLRHSRSTSSTMSENGLNSVIYDLSQVQ